MQRKSSFYGILAILSILFSGQIHAADVPVKREMRSAWVATVWQLD